MYVVIAGGGSLGGGLARKLVENRHDVVVIDQEKSACEDIAAKTGALALHGIATNIDVLEEAGLQKADVAVAALPYDAPNLAFSLLAHDFKVPNIIARIRRTRYEAAYKLAGVTRTLDVSSLFVSRLVLEIEQPALREVATFGGGKGSIVVAVVPEGARVHGKTVMEVARDRGFPDECVLAGIYREATEEFIIPRGPIEIHSGDRVFLAANIANIRKAAAFLQRTK